MYNYTRVPYYIYNNDNRQLYIFLAISIAIITLLVIILFNNRCPESNESVIVIDGQKTLKQEMLNPLPVGEVFKKMFIDDIGLKKSI